MDYYLLHQSMQQCYNSCIPFSNCDPYLYYFPQQQYNISQSLNCQSLTFSSELSIVPNQEESNPNTQSAEEKLLPPSIPQLDLKEGDSSTFSKASKITEGMILKKEPFSNTVTKNKDVKLDFRIEWKN